MEALFAVLLGHLPHQSILLATILQLFSPYYCSSFFISNLFSVLLWLDSCIWLYLFNSLHRLFQFHYPTFHILNLHSFCLLHYSFFMHSSFQLLLLLLSTFCIAKKNVKYCLSPSFCLPHLLQSLYWFQTACLCKQFVLSSFSSKPMSLQCCLALKWIHFQYSGTSVTPYFCSILFSVPSDSSHILSLNFYISFFFCSTRQETRPGITLPSSVTLTLWEIWASKLSEYRSIKIPFFAPFLN